MRCLLDFCVTLCVFSSISPAPTVSQASGSDSDISSNSNCIKSTANLYDEFLPQNRTFHLRAEAKSGTTWFQEIAFQLLSETCAWYDRSISGISCKALCIAEKDSECDGLPQCAFSSTESCRNLQADFAVLKENVTDKNGNQMSGSNRVVRRLKIKTGSKHIIPFISEMEHPNKTPLLRGTPDWLEECIKKGNTQCLPPMSALEIPFGMHVEKARVALSPFYGSSKAVKFHSSAPRKRGIPDTNSEPAILTIYRDPRSVTTSAAHYAPGAHLIGVKEYSKKESVNVFVQSAINMTTSWTQFRKFWLGKLKTDSIIPIFETYYQDLVQDPEVQVRRLATFLGLACSTDAIVQRVAEQNSQSYYEKQGVTKIQHVPMVRAESRPKDVLHGFMQELDANTLNVVNTTLLQILDKDLLRRWMGEAYALKARPGWDPSTNQLPDIMKRLRACCDPMGRSINLGNFWSNGECMVDPEQTQNSTQRQRKRTSGNKFENNDLDTVSTLDQWIIKGLSFLSNRGKRIVTAQATNQRTMQRTKQRPSITSQNKHPSVGSSIAASEALLGAAEDEANVLRMLKDASQEHSKDEGISPHIYLVSDIVEYERIENMVLEPVLDAMITANDNHALVQFLSNGTLSNVTYINIRDEFSQLLDSSMVNGTEARFLRSEPNSGISLSQRHNTFSKNSKKKKKKKKKKKRMACTVLRQRLL